MVFSSDLLKFFWSCDQTFLNKNLFLALVSIWIHFWVRLSVMLISVPFNFFLFLKTLFLMLYLANVMMIDLDCLPFLSFKSNGFNLYQYLWAFLAKAQSRLPSQQHRYIHFHFPLHHAPQYSFYKNIANSCQWLYLNHEIFIHLSFFFEFIDFQGL